MEPELEKTLSVGVIGTGSIGTDHVRRLSRAISGATVQAVFDVDKERAASVADEFGVPARSDARDVIDDPGTDAVLVASADESHAEMVLACIAAGKPVLCEKPLAPTLSECLEVLSAEEAAGRQLVQVGFMRRYDDGFLALESATASGVVGEVVAAHCVHRNASSPPGFTSAMSFTSSVVHEIDTMRWLLGEEIAAVTVVRTRSSPLAPQGLLDPQLVLLESESGIVVDCEVFVNCQYGYDVRCELVGSLGAVSLDEPSPSTVSVAGERHRAVLPDWRDRFAPAYRTEVQRWVDAVRTGLETGGSVVVPGGPSAWDGCAATAVAEAAVAALSTGMKTSVDLQPRPALYF